MHLPFDLRTGRLVDDVWARWLAWDPVRMVPALRRGPARSARDLSRWWHPRRVVPGSRGARLPRRPRRDRRHGRRLRASSTRRMAASTIATRAAWPTLRSACRATPDGARTGCMHAHGGAAALTSSAPTGPGGVPRPPDAPGHVVLDGADVTLGAGVVPAPREPGADRAPEVAGGVARAVARDGVKPGLAAVVVGADDRAPVVGVGPPRLDRAALDLLGRRGVRQRRPDRSSRSRGRSRRRGRGAAGRAGRRRGGRRRRCGVPRPW